MEDTITLEFPDGSIVVTEIQGIFEVDGQDYVLLTSEDDFFVYRAGTDIDGDLMISPIESEDEYAKVLDVLDNMIEDEDA